MRNFFLACAVLLFGLSATAAATEVKVPLSKFMSETKPLRMGNQSGSASLSIPVAKRLALKQAKLHLAYTNSVGLVRGRSALSIMVNDKTVKQFALDPAQPDSVVDIELPVSLFKAGYNALTFNVVQHYSDSAGSCEDQMAPELWTEIDSVNSTITFDGDLRSVSPVLSDLEHYFDPKLSNYWKLNVLVAQTGEPDMKHLQWGNLAAQGVANRLKYVPLAVNYTTAETSSEQPGDFPGLNRQGLGDTDGVLVGTAAELRPYLSAQVKAAIQGAFLGVYPLDATSGRILVVISGRDEQEVEMAARAFAHAMVSMPHSQSTVIDKFVLPKWRAYDAAGMLRYDQKYTFKRLGQDTKTVKGFYATDMGFEFSVPPDMFVNEHNGVKLDLHLTYGAGLRSDSVVNVMLNRHFVTAIHLGAPQGAELRHYEIMLPARSLLPGKNQLEIQPQMTPSVTGNCSLAQDRNLLLTLHGDSVLQMPDGEHYAEMPNLTLTAKAGFPYSIQPNGENTQVWLPHATQASASAAMTLLGRLAQQTGIPLAAVDFVTRGQPFESSNLIVVGLQNVLPKELDAKSPYQFAQGLSSVEPSRLLQPSPAAAVGKGEVGASLNVVEGYGDRPQASMRSRSSLGESALLLQFESPFESGKTAMVLTAASDELLRLRTNALVTPEFWTNVGGDVFRWEATDQSIFVDHVGATYHMGSIGTVSRLDFYFSHYPELWVVVSLLALLALVAVTRVLVRRYRAKHYAQ